MDCSQDTQDKYCVGQLQVVVDGALGLVQIQARSQPEIVSTHA